MPSGNQLHSGPFDGAVVGLLVGASSFSFVSGAFLGAPPQCPAWRGRFFVQGETVAHPLVTKWGLCLAAGRLGGSGDWSFLCRLVPVLVRAPPLGGPGPLLFQFGRYVVENVAFVEDLQD